MVFIEPIKMRSGAGKKPNEIFFLILFQLNFLPGECVTLFLRYFFKGGAIDIERSKTQRGGGGYLSTAKCNG